MTMMEHVQEFSPEDLAVREALARRIRKHINRGTAMMPEGVEAAVVVGALLDVLGEIATGAPCDVTQGQLLGGAIHALRTIEGVNYEEVNRTIRILELSDEPVGGRA